MADNVNGSQAIRYLASYGLEQQVPTHHVLGSLLQGILADGAVGGMSAGDAAAALKLATGLTFDSVELRSCAELDASLGIQVTSNEPPYLLLSAEARRATLQRLDSASAAEAEVLGEWAKQILATSGSPGVSPEMVSQDLRLFYFHVVLVHGLETVALAYGRRDQALRFVSNIDKETWDRIPERVSGYRKFCQQVFPDFFLQANGKRAALVAELLDRTFELCRLNLAPADSKALVSSLSGLTVYLDTNVVFRLLGLHGPAAHLDVRRILELAAEARAVARVTPRTLREFEGAARNAIREGRRFVAPQALLGLRAEADDRAFFTEYHRLLATSALGVDDLLASVRHVERTLEAFGVKVWTEKVSTVEAEPDSVASVARELHDLYERVQANRGPEQRRAVPWETAEHDAYHLRLIQVLRDPKAYSFNRSKFWFLTYHRTLARKALAIAGDDHVPCTMLVEQFHQLLRSVLPRSNSFDETFVRNLYSPLFQLHRGNYTSAMERVAARLMQYKNLASEHFANIVSDTALVARVVHVLNQPDPRADKGVDALIESRLNVELQAEREARLKATRRAADEAQRAETAAARATEDARRRAEAEERSAALQAELASTLTRVRALEAADQARLLSSQKARSRLALAGRLGVAALLGLALAALWLYYVDGYTVRGTPVNAVGVTVGIVGLILATVFPTRTSWIGAAVAFVLSILGLSAWNANSAGAAAPTAPPRSGSSTPE